MERLTRADIDNIDLIAFENYSVHECLQNIDTVDYVNYPPPKGSGLLSNGSPD